MTSRAAFFFFVINYPLGVIHSCHLCCEGGDYWIILKQFIGYCMSVRTVLEVGVVIEKALFTDSV